MEAIITHYSEGRYIAKSAGKTASVDIDYAMSSDENHLAAARKLAAKLGYAGKFYTGEVGNKCVFVRAEHNEAI